MFDNLAFPVPGVGLLGRRGTRGEGVVGGNFQIVFLNNKNWNFRFENISSVS